MSTLSQFATSGIGTSLTVTNFIIKCAQFCGPYQYARNAPLGARIECGFIICRSSGTAWIVAPIFTEISRNWYARNDANIVANLCTSGAGWFVPTLTQLQNPGQNCRAYWDSYSYTCYWSSTEYNDANALLADVSCLFTNYANKNNSRCVRAFRCVTY